MSSSDDSKNSVFLRLAYLEIAGILLLVGLITWSCITGHIVIGATGLVILPFWTAAGYIGLSYATVRKPGKSHVAITYQVGETKGDKVEQEAIPLWSAVPRLTS